MRDNGKYWKEGGKAVQKSILDAAKARHAARTKGGQKIHTTEKKENVQLLTKYETNEQVNKTFKDINDTLKEKWFENGDLNLVITDKDGINGSTNCRGTIRLKPERLENVKSALGKIGSGADYKISEDEADAMATFWHEITHNRNKKITEYATTDIQRDYMEMMNEFVARKTLPEFYSKVGAAKTPYPIFINIRESTGYNQMVTSYDYVIKRLKLYKRKVLKSARKNLFSKGYNKQKETAVQALIDGGLNDFTLTDGNKVKKSTINRIVEKCIDIFGTKDKIEQLLKENKFIK